MYYSDYQPQSTYSWLVIMQVSNFFFKESSSQEPIQPFSFS